MSHHHTGSIVKNYVLTALLSFSVMFFLFTGMARCSGPYKKQGCPQHDAHHSTTEHKTEHKTEAAHH